jgi:hypothetical protein
MSRIAVFTIIVPLTLSMGTARAADLGAMPTKAPLAEPVPALSGYLELYTGGAWNHETETGETENSRAWVIGGAGRVNYWWSRNASVQFDVQGDGASYTGQTSGPTRFSAHSELIGAHVNWRNEQGLIGVFAGAGDVSPDELMPGAARHGLGGVEGQLYWNQFTLYGQAGYDSTIGGLSSGPGTLDTVWAWFVRGTGRYYVTPNLRLEGTLQYANGSHDFTAIAPNVSFDTLLWRGKVEYKFDASPFAIFGAYQGTRTSFIPERVFDHRVLAGMRIYFGDSTLRANDRSGATLDIIEPLALLTPSLN